MKIDFEFDGNPRRITTGVPDDYASEPHIRYYKKSTPAWNKIKIPCRRSVKLLLKNRECYHIGFIKNEGEYKNTHIKKRKSKYNSEFKNKARLLRERHKVCQQCDSNYYLMVHHKDKNTLNNSDSNLILLCFNCHKKHHPHLKIPSFMRNSTNEHTRSTTR